MTPSKSAERYTMLHRLLHWLIALLVAGLLASGMIMEDLEWNAAEGALKNSLYFNHKSVGALLIGLMVLRLLSRLFSRAPAPEPDMPVLFKLAGGAGHLALYVLLIATPLLGWSATAAGDFPLPVFGLFELPKFLAKDADLSETLFEAHELAANLLLLVVIAHIGAAFFHLFIRRDGVFRRMWF
ncbi:MAG: cytochrome b [Neomegalonema sp.]|nr:cytochrome b [Neomegalonema sp.]